ncbi:MAG: AAA family ATPase [Brevinematia bacterium]
MKLKEIRLKNFGSYKDCTLDLRNLMDSPIILVIGDTGSGKSTLLDGIVFALYQKVLRYQSREISSVRRLDALEDEETFSEIVFEISDSSRNITYSVKRILKVIGRNNEYSVEIKEDGKEKGGGRRELSDQISENLLKCDYELFTRSIVLPQGQFSAFLKSDDPRQRREILEEIFPELRIYRRIKAKISERLNKCSNYSEDENKIKELEEELSSLLGEIKENVKI